MTLAQIASALILLAGCPSSFNRPHDDLGPDALQGEYGVLLICRAELL